MNQLTGKKILVLVSNGVEEHVMSSTMRELVKTGAIVKTVSTEPGLVNSWNNSTNGWGLYFPVDQQIGQVLGADFDYLVVPAGARGVQKLATNAHADRIITSFITACKPMAFMGNGVELLAKISLATGWNVAGPEASRAVMTAAGAQWTGQPVCTHNTLFTGDCEDVIAFVGAMASHFAGTAVEVKAAA